MGWRLVLLLGLSCLVVACGNWSSEPNAAQDVLPPSADTSVSTRTLKRETTARPPQIQAPTKTPSTSPPSLVTQPPRIPEPEPNACGTWTQRDEPATKTDNFFPSGFMVGAVRTKSAVAWTRTKRPERLRLHYSAGPDCPMTVSEIYENHRRQDYTVNVKLEKLRPETLYQYRWEVVGEKGLSRPGWFRTAPERDTAVTLAFSADISHKKSFYYVLDDVIATKPDLFLSLGDWPYADLKPRAESLEEFYIKHAQTRETPIVQAFTRTMGLHAVWDDHEVQNDWDAKKRRALGDRLTDALSAWHTYFPTRDVPIKGSIYRKYMWGAGIELFHLDCRLFRDANKGPDAPERTMLGAKQRDWLFNALIDSTATFKLIVTSVPLAYGTTGRDHWEGFREERKRLLDFIQDNRLKGVVFLTGDQHWLSIHHLPSGLKEFQVGPLAIWTRTPLKDPPPEVRLQKEALNFGLLRYKPGPQATLTFQSFGDKGKLLYEETIPSGLGSIRLDAMSPHVTWQLEGAHFFRNQGSAELSMVTPGDYTLQLTPAFDTLQPKTSQKFSIENRSKPVQITLPTPQVEPTELEPFNALMPAWFPTEKSCPRGGSWRVEEGVAHTDGSCRSARLQRRAAWNGGWWVMRLKRFMPGYYRRRDKNSHFGLEYGQQGDGRGYHVLIRPNARLVQLILNDGNNSTVLGEFKGKNTLIPWASWSLIAVGYRDGLHRVVIDGRSVLAVNDNTFSAGTTNIWARQGAIKVDDIGFYP